MKYRVNVPPTTEQGSYSTVVRDGNGQTKAQEALQDYNSARAHDDLPPVRRMPNGTTYRPIFEYVIQQYTGSQYGWEDVCTEETQQAGKDRLKEYRENQPQYPARMIARPEKD